MERRIIFFIILAIAVMVILILYLGVYLVPEAVNSEIKELKENIGTLQNEVTQVAERTGVTATSMTNDYTSLANRTAVISKEATAMADSFNSLAATATIMAATTTAQAPVTRKVKEGESVDLFDQELSVTLEGYSCPVVCSSVTFSVRSLKSARQTFEGIYLDEAVFYKGKNRYTILVSDISEDEGTLVVEFVVSIS
ncbi:MAG: hypothetical protein KJ077_27155 [Anaerolineae bacterium]|nr:hypothetical protein [Anaerolineae bacterium]